MSIYSINENIREIAKLSPREFLHVRSPKIVKISVRKIYGVYSNLQCNRGMQLEIYSFNVSLISIAKSSQFYMKI